MAPNLWEVLSESNRIIKAHPRHYLTLSLTFLLPLSFFSLLFQNLFKQFQLQNINHTVLFFYLLVVLAFSFSAVISITYSVFHSFHGQPVKLPDAIKSISTTFFPLLATTIVYQVILFFILFLFGLLVGLLLGLIIIAAKIDITTSPYLPVLLMSVLFMVILLPVVMYLQVNWTLVSVIVVILLPVVMYLQVNWTLVSVIVVVETCWGLEPLRRSARLVKGMKRVVLFSFFLFAFLQGILTWSCSISTTGYSLLIAISPVLAMLMLYNLAVNTVLYIRCKANHGELELVDEFKMGKDSDGLPLIP